MNNPNTFLADYRAMMAIRVVKLAMLTELGIDPSGHELIVEFPEIPGDTNEELLELLYLQAMPENFDEVDYPLLIEEVTNVVRIYLRQKATENLGILAKIANW